MNDSLYTMNTGLTHERFLPKYQNGVCLTGKTKIIPKESTLEKTVGPLAFA